MRLRNQRGQIIIFNMIAIVFLLVVAGGLANDVTRMVSDKQDVQAALDAAALAGAGKLGFDATVFPTAFKFAADFASSNKTRGGTIVLNKNVGALDWQTFTGHSMPYGDVTLGVWDPTLPDGIGTGKRFAPSLDGTIVNAVMCRYKRQIPASFLSLWGLVQMNIAASAVATANPPQDPASCVFPIGLSSCPFENNDTFTSGGCGVTIKFISSNTAPDAGNTAAWINMSGEGTPNSNYLTTAIDAAVNGLNTNVCPATAALNTNVGTQNGMDTPAFNDMVRNLKSHFGPISEPIKDKNGHVTYDGPGWEIEVPVIKTTCTADGTTGPITGAHMIIGWTKMVMTQAWDPTGNNGPKIGQGCVVNNPSDTATWPYCQMAKKDLPPSLTGGNTRSLWGYYQCGYSTKQPTPTPVPRAALATKLRLVR